MNAIKFIVLIFKIAIGSGCIILGLIAIGVFTVAVIEVFPAVGIVLSAIAVIAVSFAVYRLIIFVKEKKEENKAAENRRKYLQEKYNIDTK